MDYGIINLIKRKQLFLSNSNLLSRSRALSLSHFGGWCVALSSEVEYIFFFKCVPPERLLRTQLLIVVAMKTRRDGQIEIGNNHIFSCWSEKRKKIEIFVSRIVFRCVHRTHGNNDFRSISIATNSFELLAELIRGMSRICWRKKTRMLTLSSVSNSLIHRNMSGINLFTFVCFHFESTEHDGEPHDTVVCYMERRSKYSMCLSVLRKWECIRETSVTIRARVNEQQWAAAGHVENVASAICCHGFEWAASSQIATVEMHW